MSDSSSCCLLQSAAGYEVRLIGDEVTVETIATVDVDEIAARVDDFLRRYGASTRKLSDKIILLLDPRETLFAAAPLPSDRKLRDPRQLKFAAETVLPIDAEEMIADFTIEQSEFRVVATFKSRLVPLTDAFHRRGLHFRGITAVPLLAIEQAIEQHDVNRGAIVWEEPESADYFWVDKKGVKRWVHVQGDIGQKLLGLRLFHAKTSGEVPWTLLNASSQLTETARSLLANEATAIHLESQTDLADRAAVRFTKSMRGPWIDLRDGEAAGSDRFRVLRSWAWLAYASLILLLAATSGALWWKSQQMAGVVSQIEEAEVALFQNHFPEQLVPDNVADVIAQKRLEARGSRALDGKVEVTPSAFASLYQVLAAIQQSESEIVVERIEIEDGFLVSLDVKLNSPRVVEVLTAKLEDLGFRLESPNTSTEANGTTRATFRSLLSAPELSLNSSDFKRGAQRRGTLL